MAVKDRTRKAKRRTAAGEKCLTCPNKAFSRGLCNRCLARARAAIENGEMAEQAMIAAGLMLEPKRRGRPSENGFAKALARAKSAPAKKGGA